MMYVIYTRQFENKYVIFTPKPELSPHIGKMVCTIQEEKYTEICLCRQLNFNQNEAKCLVSALWNMFELRMCSYDTSTYI